MNFLNPRRAWVAPPREDEVPYQSACVQGSNSYNPYKGCVTAMSLSLGAVFANFAHRTTMERAPA